MPDQLSRTVAFLRSKMVPPPDALLILGSGLGGVADEVSGARLPYVEVPGFPRSTVAGHHGELVHGEWEGVGVVALSGRFHLYEGWSPDEVALPIRALVALSPRLMVVTNAAGGIRAGMRAGDLMLIADHLNLMWRNPLVGPVGVGEQRFPDMADPYERRIRKLVKAIALELGIPLEEGIYAAVSGPSYETPAEIRMLARFGADAVGMSTVPETLIARAAGVPVLGISCITNLAAGLSEAPLSHAEVLEVGARSRDRLVTLLRSALPELTGRAFAPQSDRR
jgi:purine-nucleoside phosphorylase